MVKKSDILPIMIREHCKLESSLDNLELNTRSDFKSMIKSFKNFEWKLEKHIFIEEKIIFTKYNPSDVTEGYKMLPKLTEQHNYILNIINNWREDIRNNKMITGLYDFKDYMVDHKIFEENEVYPRFDNELTDEQKKEMINKINEII
jgi:hemerythrin superfamily protein